MKPAATRVNTDVTSCLWMGIIMFPPAELRHFCISSKLLIDLEKSCVLPNVVFIFSLSPIQELCWDNRTPLNDCNVNMLHGCLIDWQVSGVEGSIKATQRDNIASALFWPYIKIGFYFVSVILYVTILSFIWIYLLFMSSTCVSLLKPWNVSSRILQWTRL